MYKFFQKTKFDFSLKLLRFDTFISMLLKKGNQITDIDAFTLLYVSEKSRNLHAFVV